VRSVADALEALAAALEASEFERAGPIASTAPEVPPRSEPVRAAVKAVLRKPADAAAAALEAGGFAHQQAAQRADLAIATLVPARARRADATAAELRAGSAMRKSRRALAPRCTMPPFIRSVAQGSRCKTGADPPL
jgi:hypothetical protein